MGTFNEDLLSVVRLPEKVNEAIVATYGSRFDKELGLSGLVGVVHYPREANGENVPSWYAHYVRPLPLNDEDPDDLSRLTLGELTTGIGAEKMDRFARLSPLINARLKGSSDEETVSSWMALLVVSEGDQSKRLCDVLDSARRLGRIEHTDEAGSSPA
jgi:hypothetical protein